MTKLAGWLKDLQDWKVIVGLVLTLFAAGVSFGAGTVNLMGLPSEVAANTEAVGALQETWTDWRGEWRSYLVRDSIFKWETRCVIEMQVAGEVPGYNDCKPNGGN